MPVRRIAAPAQRRLVEEGIGALRAERAGHLRNCRRLRSGFVRAGKRPRELFVDIAPVVDVARAVRQP